MPKPLIDLGPYKGLITTWFQDDISCDIAKRLANEHNIVCTGCMIKRCLKEWEITKQAHIVETVALCLKIAGMFYMNFPDDAIVHALNEEGCPIGKTTVIQVQKAQGCKWQLTIWE